jgi:hypothetical protein
VLIIAINKPGSIDGVKTRDRRRLPRRRFFK